ncbi:hypothetical protein [Pseudomonas sp. TMB3-21]
MSVEARKIYDGYREVGGNFIDTADQYREKRERIYFPEINPSPMVPYGLYGPSLIAMRVNDES